MAKNSKRKKILVIVESPSKAKTINKYLGSEYIVTSSVGHVIDLPKSRLAVDVNNNFKPEYITIRGKAKILNQLRKQASETSQVLIATDPDREGEAISWHLANSLASKNDNIKRIEFNEITKAAVLEAISHPRGIDLDRVYAQQARRILDRIVGYNISPLLWKKVKRGLSAGRVQSVALMVVCEREEIIDVFTPVEYWTLDIDCSRDKKKFTSSFYSLNKQKIALKTKDEVDNIVKDISGKKLVVEDIRKKERKRNPSPPYITSRLQQDASNRLGFTSQKTMIIAQQLYEGINITGEGPIGLITYMRTDSVRISGPALNSARQYILDNFGADNLPERPVYYKNKKGSQDAHEAVRPSDINRFPDSIKDDLTKDQYRLYEMIWKKFIASQMLPEISEVITADLATGDYIFRATGSRVLFRGFTLIDKNEKTEKNVLPSLQTGDDVLMEKFNPEQHFTSPPPRFNDASLVKFLEESGIGRPSTYAPTINTLIKRFYVTRSGKQFVPTVLGKLVNKIMVKHFSNLLSINFTANMEEKLDLIEEAKFNWEKMLHEFYDPFKNDVDKAREDMEEMKNIFDEETSIVCEKCGKKMLKRIGRYGYFLACSGFPDCRNAKSLPLGKCPKCEGNVVKRESKKGKGKGAFYSCSTYPDCDFISRESPSGKPCPKCGRLLFIQRKKGFGEKLTCLRETCGFSVDLLDEKDDKNDSSENANNVNED